MSQPPASSAPRPRPPPDIDLKFEGYRDDLLELCDGKLVSRCLDRRLQASDEDWRRTWKRLVDALCYLEEASGWLKTQVSEQYKGKHSCGNRPLVAALYQQEHLQRGDAAGFAAHVKFRATEGSWMRDALEHWRAHVRRFAAGAPEDSLPDRSCGFCTFADADWQLVELSVEVAERDSRRMARALAQTWPDLARALGGEQASTELLELYYLSLVAGGDYDQDPGDPGNESPDQGRTLPPPKDPDYRQRVDPWIRACAMSGEGDIADNVTFKDCMRRRMQEELGGSKGPFATYFQRWHRFVRALCRADEVARPLGFPWPDRHASDQPYVASTQCPALASTRGSFLAHSLNSGAVEPFLRHAETHAAWGDRIKTGIDQLQQLTRAPECIDTTPVDLSCRSGLASASDWRELRQATAAVEDQLPALSSALCSAWPELRQALGAADACKTRMDRYHLSYATFLATSGAPGAPYR